MPKFNSCDKDLPHNQNKIYIYIYKKRRNLKTDIAFHPSMKCCSVSKMNRRLEMKTTIRQKGR